MIFYKDFAATLHKIKNDNSASPVAAIQLTISDESPIFILLNNLLTNTKINMVILLKGLLT
jgi:hypothetical protein